MAGDWIKMRNNLDSDPRVFAIAERLGLSSQQVVFHLYLLCCYLNNHGAYGNLKDCHRLAVDHICSAGFLDAIESVGWSRSENGWTMFSGFTKANTERKSLGKKIRREVLSVGSCLICSANFDLVVDHDVPISRGGTSEQSNLLCLCRSCNLKKSTKTLAEFLGS